MTTANHLVVGAIIGVAIKQPLVALPVAYGSHFVLDALPRYGDPANHGCGSIVFSRRTISFTDDN